MLVLPSTGRRCSDVKWLVKVSRYTGGESVVSRHEFKSEADRDAQQMNEWYQTDRYYVEEWKWNTDD